MRGAVGAVQHGPAGGHLHEVAPETGADKSWSSKVKDSVVDRSCGDAGAGGGRRDHEIEDDASFRKWSNADTEDGESCGHE